MMGHSKPKRKISTDLTLTSEFFGTSIVDQRLQCTTLIWKLICNLLQLSSDLIY